MTRKNRLGFYLRALPGDKEAFQALATAWDVGMSEAIRRAVRLALEQAAISDSGAKGG